MMNTVDFLQANATGLNYPDARESFRETCLDIQGTTEQHLTAFLAAVPRPEGRLDCPESLDVYMASTETHLFTLNPRNMQWGVSEAGVDGVRPVFIMPRNQTLQ